MREGRVLGLAQALAQALVRALVRALGQVLGAELSRYRQGLRPAGFLRGWLQIQIQPARRRESCCSSLRG